MVSSTEWKMIKGLRLDDTKILLTRKSNRNLWCNRRDKSKQREQTEMLLWFYWEVSSRVGIFLLESSDRQPDVTITYYYYYYLLSAFTCTLLPQFPLPALYWYLFSLHSIPPFISLSILPMKRIHYNGTRVSHFPFDQCFPGPWSLFQSSHTDSFLGPVIRPVQVVSHPVHSYTLHRVDRWDKHKQWLWSFSTQHKAYHVLYK